ncbi:MMPL family transporter [Streptomyces paludis]|uniref:MMPL family transporter n=1 Tax=Streptomyces paludis TaxID=2282738 RepID=A0A345HQY1_9ACTN|nr:MMPL family transporter [Streptomyces paludis]AXG79105.1 MMPL family transporter [Streptomyces paludis]
MATLLYRLGRTAYRRWPVFLAGWLIALVAAGAVAGAFSKPMTSSFTIPGIPSMRAAELQRELFPGARDVEAPTVTVVVAAPKGAKLAEEPYASAIARLVSEIGALEHVPGPVAGPVEAADALRRTAGDAPELLAATLPLSADGRVGTVDFAFDVPEVADVTPEMKTEVMDILGDARGAGLQVEVSGPGMETMAAPGSTAEIIGIGVALVVLALTFGSLVSAGMPVLSAGVGVGLGVLGITALTAFVDVPDTTTILATMLGLAVGIDYALFILARYRGELQHTEDREEAMGIAVGTAGSAVVFAGLTVIIALVALSVVGIGFLTAMGLGAAVTVAISILVALTLIPALGGMLKSKIFGGRFRRYVPARDESGEVLNHGVRWARVVARAPFVWILVVVIGLGAMALPFKDIHMGLPGDSTAPTDTTARKASDLITESFGPGRLSPLLVVVDGRNVTPAQRQRAYEQVTAWAAGQDNVAHAALAGTSENGAMVLVEPAAGPESVAAEELLSDLRDTAVIEKRTGVTLGVTGISAVQADISDRLSGALVPYLAIVIGLAFLLLVLVFRSILVPLTATFGFLLSILATLGAMVAVFQKSAFGWFPGEPIVSFLPIFLVGVVFGLAMDYQVFLVTRIREAHVRGASPQEAVRDGFRSSARVVTAAALIMTAVFSGFVFMADTMIKSMGFGLAVAVIFDAFAVRMCLIPALLYLMGDKAWWLPKWLDRVLPNVDIEGENAMTDSGDQRLAGDQRLDKAGAR